jgi:hypothetical protein
MKKLLCIGFLLINIWANSQDETIKNLQVETTAAGKKGPADTLRFWRKGGAYNMNLSQASLNNWAAGGDEFSLAINSLLNLFAFYKKDKYSWDNTFDFNFGYVKTTSLGSRKNDDRIDLLSKYGYALTRHHHLNLAGLFNFRTQLLKGYTYADNIKTLSSNFLSPAYILLGIGLDYKPTRDFSLFFSPLTARWIIVKDDTLSAKGLYGVVPGKKSVSEFGAFLTANYLKDVTKSLLYKGRLDLFSNYRRNPEKIDLFMTNAFLLKISKILSASWNLDFIYDDDVRLFGKIKNRQHYK